MADHCALFECPRCFQQYNSDDRKPKYLSCHDTVCLACAKRLVQRGNITCPKCLGETTVSNLDVDVLRTDHEKLLFLGHRSGESANRQILWCWTCQSKAKDVCSSLCHQTAQMSEVQGKSIPVEVPHKKNWSEAKATRIKLQSHITNLRESLHRLLYQLDGIEDENNHQINNIQLKLQEHSEKASPFDLSTALATKRSASDLLEAQQLLFNFHHSEEVPMSIALGHDFDQLFEISFSTSFINPLDQSGETFSGHDARNIISCIMGFIQRKKTTSPSSEVPVSPVAAFGLPSTDKLMKPKPDSGIFQTAAFKRMQPMAGVVDRNWVNNLNGLVTSLDDSTDFHPARSHDDPFQDSRLFTLRRGGGRLSRDRMAAINNFVTQSLCPDSPPPSSTSAPIPAQRLVHQGTNTLESVPQLQSSATQPPISGLTVNPAPRQLATSHPVTHYENNDPFGVEPAVPAAFEEEEEIVTTRSSKSTNSGSSSQHYVHSPREEIYIDVVPPKTKTIPTTTTRKCTWHPSSDWVVSTTEGSDAMVTFCPQNPLQKAKWVRLQHFDDPVKQMTWSPNGTILVTGSQNGCVRLWKISPNDDVIKAYCTLKQHMNEISALQFNSKGTYLLSGGVDHKLYAWNLKINPTLEQEWDYHKDNIVDVDWKDDIIFATASADGIIYLGKVGCKEPIKTFTGNWAHCVRWDASKQFLALCATDASLIKVWSFGNNEFLSLHGHKQPVTDMSWSSILTTKDDSETKPRYLVSGSKDKTVRVWDVQKGKEKHSVSRKSKSEVNCLAVSPNGKVFVTGSNTGHIELYNLKKGGKIFSDSIGDNIQQISWNSSGDKIAIATVTSGLKIIGVAKYIKSSRKALSPK